MAFLSLREAAEQARTSKVDIWRAIREGRLSAERSADGEFAIDPTELFRVFETQRPEQSVTEKETKASVEAGGRPDRDRLGEIDDTTDIASAFLALEAEMKGLLGLPAATGANAELRQDNSEKREAELARLASELAAERAKAEKVMAEYAAVADRLAALAAERERRPWWRRIVG
jgi:hypothetical protein